MELILYGRPITKKNNGRIVMAGRYPKLLPSQKYVEYERDCLKQITGKYKQMIDYPINLKCVYYMPTKHRVDLTNLLNATNDILVAAGVLADDDSKIVASMDGSRVLYDKENPRVEIEIKELR